MSNEVIRSEVDLSAIQIPDQSFSLAEFKQIVYRRWKPALAVGIASFTVIFLFIALKTPKYRSETLILLENPQNQSSAPVAPNQPATNRFYSITDLSTEIFVLRSKSLISRGVQKLKNRYPEISVGEVVNNLSIYQAATNEIPTDVLVVSYTDTDPEKAKAILEALGQTYIDYSLEKQRLKARNAIEFIDNQLPDAQQELDEAAKEIRQFRQVHQLVDPEVSAMTAGEARQTIALEIQKTQIAIDLNRKQRQELEQHLQELGQDSETMLASSVLGEDGVYQNLASQLRELETQYNLGRTDYHQEFPILSSLKEKRTELKRLLQERAEQVLGKSISPKVLERIVLSPSYTDAQASAGANTVTGNTPDTTNTNSTNSKGNAVSNGAVGSNSVIDNSGSGSRISSAGSTLGILAARKLELENEAATLQSQLTSLSREKSEADSDFVNIPSLQQTFMELKRQLELKSEAYDYLLEKRQELKISEAEEIAPWRILNEPFLPNKPIAPNIQQGLIQALIAGGFLAVATAFMLQKLDQSIKQVEEIKQLTRLPLLGIVPKVSEPRIDANIHTTRQSYSYYSSFAEGLRALAMNLRYLLVNEGQVKTLAITSSTSAEGKSTISYNLGIVLAELGLRVLIVDGDLRKPKLHKIAQIPNETGLSEAITTDNPWTDYIQSGSVDNLSLITAGATSPNPIALLNSEKMKQLIEAWKDGYDYVIIDTPPVGVIADTKSLANKIDSILFIVGIQRASRKSIRNSLDILSQSQCELAGIVANMVNPEFDYYAYSYYDYYYNQSNQERDDDLNNSDRSGRKRGILEQFRRR